MNAVRVLCIWVLMMFPSWAAVANAPAVSSRPAARPVGLNNYIPRVTNVPVYHRAGLRPKPSRPKPRPSNWRQVPASPVATVPVQTAVQTGVQTVVPPVETRPDQLILVRGAPGITRSPRPRKRPRNLMRRFSRTAAVTSTASTPTRTNTSRRGSVCGDPAIKGSALARIRGRISACGIANPVSVTEISGVMLSQAATIDCDTAKALKTWIRTGAKPAVGRYGGGIKSLRIVAHYACQTRNNQPGGRISEHGKGKALDIAAINLNDGTSMSILKGWRNRVHGPILKRMHQSACGPFGTVLGPDANKYHQDHFHFDTAQHGNGPYCR